MGLTQQALQLDFEICCHSSLQILSNSVGLAEERQWTAPFRSFHWCSSGFQSGLWLGHARIFTELSLSQSCVVCLGSLSLILVHWRWICASSGNMSAPHSMILTPLCFSVRMSIDQVVSHACFPPDVILIIECSILVSPILWPRATQKFKTNQSYQFEYNSFIRLYIFVSKKQM